MKTFAFLAAFLASTAALAQSGPYFTNGPVGQSPGAINQQAFVNGSDAAGFSEFSLTPALVAAGTTQATAALITTRTVVITACASGAGVRLPAVNRYTPIAVVNRSGASCIVYPTVSATVESAPGTVAAVNAGITMATNTDLVFRPISPTAWVQ